MEQSNPVRQGFGFTSTLDCSTLKCSLHPLTKELVSLTTSTNSREIEFESCCQHCQIELENLHKEQAYELLSELQKVISETIQSPAYKIPVIIINCEF